MDGIIFVLLKKYVRTRLGEQAWDQVITESGVGGHFYRPLHQYRDEELNTLVGAGAHLTGQSVPTLVEDFGVFIAEDLVTMYEDLIRPEWRTLDVIENAERQIHTVVRLRNPGALPPQIVCKRLSPDEVEIEYTSPRKLCPLAKGIARGLAAHYKEQITINESSCMLNQDPVCRICVRLTR